MKRLSILILIGLFLFPLTLAADLLDRDCDARKAVKSTAMKATVGVGTGCSAKEAATDQVKDSVGIKEKGPIEKRRQDNEGIAKKAAERVVK